ncbi:hypothetical protein SAMN05444285_11379 [Draconibacterium orientale]|uniref:Uncharacterized protein n=1 Tax=Draconibacterium orientale TaxID=1168034 RepID=A0A1I0EJ51_9BACT|nr:hypothetical protein SAMN05444285_11379 [Draconibacterium orientale]
MLKFFALYKRKITGISNTAFYNQIGIKECSRPGALFFLQNLIVPVSNHFKYLVHESPYSHCATTGIYQCIFIVSLKAQAENNWHT